MHHASRQEKYTASLCPVSGLLEGHQLVDRKWVCERLTFSIQHSWTLKLSSSAAKLSSSSCMKLGNPRRDTPSIYGAFVTSAEIWDIVSNFPVIVSQTRLSRGNIGLVHLPCSSSIHRGLFDVPVYRTMGTFKTPLVTGGSGLVPVIFLRNSCVPDTCIP